MVLVLALILSLLAPSLAAYPLFALAFADNLIDKTRFRWWQRRHPRG